MTHAGRPKRIGCLGEVMIELSSGASGAVKLGFAGDTFNTAVYLARLGQSPHYLSALGADAYSRQILELCGGESIQTDHILIDPSRHPGLYSIQTDPAGERSFLYWRSESAARHMTRHRGWGDLLDWISKLDFLYLSGITLSILPPSAISELRSACRKIREQDGQVAFDPNYRPKGWDSADDALTTMRGFCEAVSIVLPGREDMEMLLGVRPIASYANIWLDAGAEQVILKDGGDSAHYFGQGAAYEKFIVPKSVQAIDTTGAGDSFNGAFLAAYLDGKPLAECFLHAHRLAAAVIQTPGAILPKSEMPV